jgi:hypothetical protein
MARGGLCLNTVAMRVRRGFDDCVQQACLGSLTNKYKKIRRNHNPT